MTFTDDRNKARTFPTFDACLAFKQTLNDADRIFARMQYADPKVGESSGYIVAITRCFNTGREEYAA